MFGLGSDAGRCVRRRGCRRGTVGLGGRFSGVVCLESGKLTWSAVERMWEGGR